jgi:ABC-type branched-subunit amino acid transport system permease subunit
MTGTLGPGAIIPAIKRAVGPSAIVLALTIVLVILTGKSGWLSVGGAVISALGARLWAFRIFRQRPERADDPPTPLMFPRKPGEQGVQVNMGAIDERIIRGLDNWYAYIGVWLTISGGIIGSAGPFLVDELRALLAK